MPVGWIQFLAVVGLMSSAPRSHPQLPAVHGSVTCGPLRGLFPSKQLASSKSAGVSSLHAYGNVMMGALQCNLMMEMASLYFAVCCWLGASPRSEPMQGCDSLEVTFRFLAAHTLTCVGCIACTVILCTSCLLCVCACMREFPLRCPLSVLQHLLLWPDFSTLPSPPCLHLLQSGSSVLGVYHAGLMVLPPAEQLKSCGTFTLADLDSRMLVFCRWQSAFLTVIKYEIT